jgi:F0F1-type ATP synthase assembly protein I
MPESPGQPDKPRPRWVRLAGIGTEFAGAVGGFCLLGWWIDRHWQISGHKAFLICALLGLLGGLYNLVRQALAAVKANQDEAKRGTDSRDG